MPVGHAELIRYPLEAAPVGRRGEVVADRDRGKAAGDAFRVQLIDFQGHIGFECRRDLAAVDDFRGHRHTRGRVLSVARSVVWTCRSTLGLAEPPFSSPHTRVTSVPSTASASSTMASEDQPPMLTV